MPPNRFESEVESFLEGSHGDRTHIKRADHHTVTPLCGTLLGVEGAGRTVHPVGAPASAKKLAQHRPYTGLSAKKFAQQAQKHQIWGVLSAQGELFRAFALTQRRRANFFAPK